MTLRRITIDNSVRFIAQSEQTKDSKPDAIKKNSIPRKQNEKFSRNNKNSLKI